MSQREQVWTKDPDGEYGEERTDLESGHVLVIHSNRDGDEWDAYIDGTDVTWDLKATNSSQARDEALKLARLG